MTANFYCRVALVAVLALSLPVAFGCRKKFKPGDHPDPVANPKPDPCPPAWSPSVVILWNQAALEAVRKSPPRPTVVARALFMLHVAMYDVWAVYDRRCRAYVVDDAALRAQTRIDESIAEIAMCYAAYFILLNQFAAYEAEHGKFAALMEQLGCPLDASDELDTPSGLGCYVAECVIADRATDGANQAGNFAQITSDMYPTLYVPKNSGDPTTGKAPGGPNFDPNRWEPLRVANGTKKDDNGHAAIDPDDPSTYSTQQFLTPHFGAVRPFGLPSGDYFQPPAPPKLGCDALYVDALGNTMTNDDAYREQTAEVLHMSANLNDLGKCIAEYWMDGPQTETPPGHWNLFAQCVSFRDRMSLKKDVKLFFVLNGALFDAAIAAWDAKRKYDYIRPISAIRHLYYGQSVEAWGGPNMGKKTISGENWMPYQYFTFVTPPFSEYVSGHSTFSMAAATVLTLFTGSPIFYNPDVRVPWDFNGDGTHDIIGEFVAQPGRMLIESGPSAPVTLRWPTFRDAAEEAGLSRLYGGIHFRDGNLWGQMLGEQVGRYAFETACELWDADHYDHDVVAD